MLFGMGRRIVAAVVALSMLSGCAEIDRRGGYVDQIEDAIFFRADTKTHRLLRSYLLATVLLTVARRQGHNDVDRTAIAGALEGALAVANEAYMCLYPGLLEPKTAGAKNSPLTPISSQDLQPNDSVRIPDEITMWGPDGQFHGAKDPLEPRWCQFFDEKMSRLDYALFRLASVTLFNSESRQALTDIQAKLVGNIPVVSDTVAAVVHANRAVNQATTVIDDLLTLAFSTASPALALLPLYRDSLELNMWVVTDHYALACKARYRATYDALVAGQGPALDTSPACAMLVAAVFSLQKGNGNPKIWRDFLKQVSVTPDDDLSTVMQIEAYRPHFFLISQLLVRSCQSVLSDGQNPNRCKTVLADALEKAAFEADNATGYLVNGETPQLSRWFTASLPLPGARFAFIRTRRMPSAVAVTAKPSAPSAKNNDDPQQTGSLGGQSKPSGTPAQSH